MEEALAVFRQWKANCENNAKTATNREHFVTMARIFETAIKAIEENKVLRCRLEKLCSLEGGAYYISLNRDLLPCENIYDAEFDDDNPICNLSKMMKIGEENG